MKRFFSIVIVIIVLVSAVVAATPVLLGEQLYYWSYLILAVLLLAFYLVKDWSYGRFDATVNLAYWLIATIWIIMAILICTAYGEKTPVQIETFLIIGFSLILSIAFASTLLGGMDDPGVIKWLILFCSVISFGFFAGCLLQSFIIGA